MVSERRKGESSSEEVEKMMKKFWQKPNEAHSHTKKVRRGKWQCHLQKLLR